VALLVSVVLLAAAGADAHAIGVNLHHAKPLVALSLPVVSTPPVEASLPSTGVSVAGVEASTPGVSVSEPSVSVSGEGASVSGPSVGVSTPSTPVTDSPPPPAGSSPPGESGDHDPAGGAGKSSAGDSGASTVGGAGGSSPSTSIVADHSPGAASARQRARKRSLTPARAARRHKPRTSSAGGHARSGIIAALGALGSGPSRASASASRAAAHSSGNLLDKIGSHIPLPIPVPDWSKPIIVALLALAVALGVRSRLARLRVRRLEGQRATMQRDLDVMQMALVPQVPAELEGLAVSVAYRPAEGPAAGGDFYDLFVVQPGRVAIILGDVAGHGREALTQAALTRYTLRAYLQSELEPRAALALAGRALADPTCESFATVAVAIYDTHAGSLKYACAGHPPPILQGPHAHEPLTLCASPPVGWTVPTGRRQTTVSLPAGTVACFFSDGLIEARRGKELLGRERVSEILAAIGPRPTATDLLHQVQQAALATPDDMAACILLPTTAAVYAHVEELEVDARQLDAAATRGFLEACEAPEHEIARALEGACDVVHAYGAALLRVAIHPTGATVEVAAPASPRRPRASADTPPARTLAAR
jgi:serine phosphatase RsbU (regulator of sigma subunit)